jgi:hypothetical protein
MITGPFFYPVAYRYYVYLVFSVIAIKSAITLIWTFKSIIDAIILCRKYDRKMELLKEP